MACFCFNDSGEDLVGETIFLNVLVENGSEGIETIVRESVSKSMGRGLISARIAKVNKISSGSGPSPYGRRPGAGLYEIPPSKDEIKEASSK